MDICFNRYRILLGVAVCYLTLGSCHDKTSTTAPPANQDPFPVIFFKDNFGRQELGADWSAVRMDSMDVVKCEDNSLIVDDRQPWGSIPIAWLIKTGYNTERNRVSFDFRNSYDSLGSFYMSFFVSGSRLFQDASLHCALQGPKLTIVQGVSEGEINLQKVPNGTGNTWYTLTITNQDKKISIAVSVKNGMELGSFTLPYSGKIEGSIGVTGYFSTLSSGTRSRISIDNFIIAQP